MTEALATNLATGVLDAVIEVVGLVVLGFIAWFWYR